MSFTIKNRWKAIVWAALGAIVLFFAFPGESWGQNLTQLLQSFQSLPQDQQSSLLDSISGMLAGNEGSTTQTPTAQDLDIKDMIKEEIKAAQKSFITFMINLIFSSIEQQFLEITGTATPTPTPSP